METILSSQHGQREGSWENSENHSGIPSHLSALQHFLSSIPNQGRSLISKDRHESHKSETSRDTAALCFTGFTYPCLTQFERLNEKTRMGLEAFNY